MHEKHSNKRLLSLISDKKAPEKLFFSKRFFTDFKALISAYQKMNKNRTCINFIEDMAGYSHKTFLAAIYSYSKQGTSRFSLQGGREFSNQGGILNIFK